MKCGRDFKPLYADISLFEPKDFIRIHQNDLRALLRMLRSIHEEFSHQAFVDRHGTADRIKKLIPPDYGDIWPAQ